MSYQTRRLNGDGTSTLDATHASPWAADRRAQRVSRREKCVVLVVQSYDGVEVTRWKRGVKREAK